LSEEEETLICEDVGFGWRRRKVSMSRCEFWFKM